MSTQATRTARGVLGEKPARKKKRSGEIKRGSSRDGNGNHIRGQRVASEEDNTSLLQSQSGSDERRSRCEGGSITAQSKTGIKKDRESQGGGGGGVWGGGGVGRGGGGGAVGGGGGGGGY